MEKLLVMDEKNYEPDMAEIYRVTVRGIIFIGEKLLLIEDGSGELKLPGGGIEKDEDEYHALTREVKEETGYDVIPETITPFGEAEEKRLSVHEPMIWHQINKLYFCSVYPEKGRCEYTENEKRRGFRQVLFPLDEAIEINRAVLEKKGSQARSPREYKLLLLIKDHLENMS